MWQLFWTGMFDWALLVIEYSYPNKSKLLFHENFFCWKYIVRIFLLIQIYDIGVCILLAQIKFWLQKESIKILQRSNFQWIFSWKWKHAYLCNIHSSTSHFVSGFVGNGYSLFGRNHLVIFILVSVCYGFSIFYSRFRIYIFEGFCCVQSVEFLRIFSTFLPDISSFLPYAAADFPALFCQFLGFFRCRLSLFFVLFEVFLHSPFCHFIVLF